MVGGLLSLYVSGNTSRIGKAEQNVTCQQRSLFLIYCTCQTTQNALVSMGRTPPSSSVFVYIRGTCQVTQQAMTRLHMSTSSRSALLYICGACQATQQAMGRLSRTPPPSSSSSYVFVARLGNKQEACSVDSPIRSNGYI